MFILRRLTTCLALGALLGPSLAWAVGATPVAVANPADIAKAQGIQQPYQVQIRCPDDGIGIRCRSGTTLPAGQRMVIEYVSGTCTINSPTQLLNQVWLTTFVGGRESFHYVPFTDHVGVMGYSHLNDIVLGHPVRIYADPGSDIGVGMDASAGSGLPGYPNCRLTLSGQLISVP